MGLRPINWGKCHKMGRSPILGALAPFGTYRRALYVSQSSAIGTYRRTSFGTYRRDIGAAIRTTWYVSQSYFRYVSQQLVRIAELFVAPSGTHRRAILWHLVRIAALFGTYRRAIRGTNWYVLQSFLVRIAELSAIR